MKLIQRQTERRGATAVEFAITAPIFFIFLLASFEFGWMNVLRHSAENAAYEGAGRNGAGCNGRRRQEQSQYHSGRRECQRRAR